MSTKTKNSLLSFMNRKNTMAAHPFDEQNDLLSGDNAISEDESLDATANAEEEMEEEILEGQLAVDLVETPDNILIRSTIAGVKPEELDINVEGNIVTISGARSASNKEEEGNYLLQECYWGSFSRSVEIPIEFDPEGVDAELKDGILTVILPKVPKLKPKKVMVRGE